MSWLVHLVMALVSVTWLSARPPGPAVAPAAEASARPPLVVVRALGPVPSERLRSACRLVLAELPVRCAVRGSRSAIAALPAWDAEREQLDARATLDLLFEARSDDAVVELHVTSLDLYEPGKPFVFGLASLPDRTAVLSLSRIEAGSTHADAASAEAAATHRFATLLRHEVGHALGLVHHDVADCVMRQDPTVASLDEAPDGPCDRCRATMVRSATRLSRPGQTALDRARGLLVRKRPEEARQVLVDALWRYRPDADLLDSFARVFFEAGQYNETISLLRHTLHGDPERPNTHLQLGLAYQRRARPGDLGRAVKHFERAATLRPDWAAATRLLEATRAEQRAQGPG